jgi:hypothetical protein
MVDTRDYLVDELKYPEGDAIIMLFIFYTPLLLLVSWILEVIVDRPSKDFSGEFDRQIRRKRPRPLSYLNEDGELVVPSEEEYYSLSEFSKRIWPMYVFVAWLLLVFISIEIFAANHTYKEIEKPSDHRE